MRMAAPGQFGLAQMTDLQVAARRKLALQGLVG